MLQTTQLSPTQLHLLRTFSFDRSEAYALEVQKVLTQHFRQLLDEEADRLWETGVLDQEKLDSLRHQDLHAKA